jgi:hypothetical protein
MLYLVEDVFERIRTVDGEADEEEVGFGVGEGSEAVVFLLAGRVPEGEFDAFPRGLVLDVGDVVFEDGGDVFLREDDVVSVVGNQWKGKLPQRWIPDFSLPLSVETEIYA